MQYYKYFLTKNKSQNYEHWKERNPNKNITQSVEDAEIKS